MCYANMVLAPGAEAFVERLARTGASGLIVPDLPLEEAVEVLAACDAHGLALVPLVAPTTPPERLAEIGARARGFLYTVSVVGTTGERAALAEQLRRGRRPRQGRHRGARGARLRDLHPRAGRAAADAGADGVIVGTRLVRAAGGVRGPRRRRGRARRRARRGAAVVETRRPRRPVGCAHDGIGLTVTAGLVVWIVLWALGAKGFDAFMLAALIMLVGACVRIVCRLPARPPSQRLRTCLNAVRGRLGRLCQAPRRQHALRRVPLGLAACCRRAARCGCGGRSRLPSRSPASSPSTPASPCRARSRPTRCRSKTARSSRSPKSVGTSGRSRSTTPRWTTPTPRPGSRPRSHRLQRQRRHPGHRDDRLPRRPRLRRHGRVAVADQRCRHPPGEPREPLRRTDLLARRRPRRAGTVLPDRPAHLRAVDARRRGAGRRPGAPDARAAPAERVRDRRPRPLQAPLASIFAEDAKRAGHRRARRRPDRNHLGHGILR